MEHSLQQTSKDEITISGNGLMRGLAVNLKICPAPVNHGIVFQRLDLDNQSVVVCAENAVDDLPRCTSIGDESVTINSVEHILSALAGMNIDNALLQLDAPEPPALDGSASAYAIQIAQAGVLKQNIPRSVV